ncbi:MAG: hypothetical protein IT377_01140 [Polyangiaceae bacterium]|nr:hypothetical protein [Polyangiaceae bacterium]
MIGMRCRCLAVAIAWASTALAEPAGVDALGHQVLVRSETHFRLYQRALLPGPYGALVTEQTAAPVVEYVSLTAHDLDAPWQKQSLDVELDLWGSATFGEAGAGRRMDGDVQNANVRYRTGPGWLRLGRQHVAGGAARYARFDGLAAGATLPVGVGAEVYAGLTVLPRWAARPGYHQLGSAAESLWRDPDALPEPRRGEHWLAGGRLFYDSPELDLGASVHEQHEAEGLAYRNLGADARFDASQKVTVGGNAVLELDARRVADGRLWAHYTPLTPLELEAEVLHAEPALFLSRQSVLAVFSTDAYEEAGGSFRARVWRQLTLTGAGFVQVYSPDDLGQRTELGARITPGHTDRTVLLLSLTRVSAPDNGYVSMRNAWRQRIQLDVATTLEAYHYRYDEPIAGYDTSSVYAGTVEWLLSPEVSALWGASYARTPYAAADAQTQIRLRVTSGGPR